MSVVDAAKIKTIKITESAANHFSKLLKQEAIGTNIRIAVVDPSTKQADLNLHFCPANEQQETDAAIAINDFTLYIEKNSVDCLVDARIDYKHDEFGGELAVKAPLLKGSKPNADSSLIDRVKYILDSEINPALGAHGGMVSLVDIVEDSIVLLRFGGGCHGCGQVEITLKQGIEKTLKNAFPEIKEIKDITNHATGENPYY